MVEPINLNVKIFDYSGDLPRSMVKVQDKINEIIDVVNNIDGECEHGQHNRDISAKEFEERPHYFIDLKFKFCPFCGKRIEI
jgi:hypothetical protein